VAAHSLAGGGPVAGSYGDSALDVAPSDIEQIEDVLGRAAAAGAGGPGHGGPGGLRRGQTRVERNAAAGTRAVQGVRHSTVGLREIGRASGREGVEVVAGDGKAGGGPGDGR